MRTRDIHTFVVAWLAIMFATTSLFGAEENGAEVTSPDDVHQMAGAEHADDHGATAGHAADGHELNLNPLSVDPDLAIVTAIVFAILMIVLWKFAWGPISEALDQREKAVADNIAEAQRQNDEAKRLLTEHESRLTSAAAEVRQMLEDAKRDAETQKQSILAEAQAAASAEKNRAIREIDSAKNAALQSLAEKSVDAAVGLAGRIVSRQLSPEDHSQLINDTLQNFPSDN
jgi:F-type H+-transporting ATPase subunit b